MNRTAMLTVAASLSLAACAHHDRTPDSRVPLGATEMQGTATPSPSPPQPQTTDVTSKTVSSKTATSSSAPDDSHFATTNAAPTDQGTSVTDVGITQAVRKALMADKKLSAPAKSVTILTSDARVVLRGRVNSARERTSVEAKVRAMPGVTEVYDQLTVRR